MKSKQTLKVGQNCEPCEFILLSNPPKNKCKHCGQIWVCTDNTPICKQSTPKKKSKEIKEINKIVRQPLKWYSLEGWTKRINKRVNIQDDKINELTDTINLLIKNK